MSVASDREQLKRLLAARSVRRGDFKLASGLTSNIYVDAKLTTLHAAAMPLVGSLFLDKIRQHQWKPRAIGGLVLGADPIVGAVARESLANDDPMDAFLVRKNAKNHGLEKFIEGLNETAGLPSSLLMTFVQLEVRRSRRLKRQEAQEWLYWAQFAWSIEKKVRKSASPSSGARSIVFSSLQSCWRPINPANWSEPKALAAKTCYKTGT
jgi:hypothetical protein